MPVAAFCTDIPEFQGGRILEESYASRFPGAAVIPAFATAIRSKGWEVVTGDQLLQERQYPSRNLGDVFVVQEEDSRVGRELLAAGAIPGVILNGESPLFARDFYRDVSRPCAVFPHRVLFTGAHESAGTQGTNHSLLFPALHSHQAPLFVPWAERKHLAILAGNKYWRHADIPWLSRAKRRLQEAVNRDQTEWLARNQLHDERLNLIAHFSNHGKIDVHGSGWDRRGHLPKKYGDALETLVPRTATVEYNAKQSLLSEYRFALTMENFVYPGYVTEKIFDALAAGAIPVYLGAPDIESFVPNDVFIDIRDFSGPSELEAFLDELTEAAGMKMIDAGRVFIESELGQRHTFENRGAFFADLVVDVAAKR